MIYKFHDLSRFQPLVPGTPRSLTAIVTSVHSIKLEWNEPVNPNGIIIAYRIYYVLNQEDTDNKDVHSFVEVSGKETSHEFENMTENRTYFFWISAKTIMGEGSSTRRVTASTSRGIYLFYLFI